MNYYRVHKPYVKYQTCELYICTSGEVVFQCFDVVANALCDAVTVTAVEIYPLQQYLHRLHTTSPDKLPSASIIVMNVLHKKRIRLYTQNTLYIGNDDLNGNQS